MPLAVLGDARVSERARAQNLLPAWPCRSGGKQPFVGIFQGDQPGSPRFGLRLGLVITGTERAARPRSRARHLAHNVTAIAAGEDFSLALLRNGTVWAWGPVRRPGSGRSGTRPARSATSYPRAVRLSRTGTPRLVG
ncbi:RCC1-like domain-containing protein [Streptomyces sp. 147326]|uniref:RCC1-like domain-containing protein n=1 Tax=Streptomyces sp. 147326 TaxID=3074379 RepID=UPI003857E6C1